VARCSGLEALSRYLVFAALSLLGVWASSINAAWRGILADCIPFENSGNAVVWLVESDGYSGL